MRNPKTLDSIKESLMRERNRQEARLLEHMKLVAASLHREGEGEARSPEVWSGGEEIKLRWGPLPSDVWTVRLIDASPLPHEEFPPRFVPLLSKGTYQVEIKANLQYLQQFGWVDLGWIEVTGPGYSKDAKHDLGQEFHDFWAILELESFNDGMPNPVAVANRGRAQNPCAAG
jgi:hypothetical protein